MINKKHYVLTITQGSVNYIKLCGSEDTKKHRLLECPKFELLRLQHREAVTILQECRPEWIHIPCARQHPDVLVHRALLKHLHISHIKQPLILENTPHVKFYTDGGCLHPTDPMARLASWSVVMEHIPDGFDLENIQQEICAQNTEDVSWSPCHTVIGLGLVTGKQTAGRGEIQAFLHAVRVANALPRRIPSIFTTDAQYVCNIVSQIERGVYQHGLHKKANPDMVTILADLWDCERFTIRKVKSHQCFNPDACSDSFWQMLGNHCADKAATAALQHLPLPVLDQAQKIFNFHREEKNMLKCVFEFLVAFNRLRIQLLQMHVTPTLNVRHNHPTMDTTHGNALHHNAMGTDALQILLNFQPDYSKTFDEEVDQTIFTAMQQGATISFALYQWLKLLKWPDNPVESHNPGEDWGISWFELTVSFIISSQLYFPIRVKGLGSESVYADYHSPECLIQHPKRRAAYVQTFCLQKLVSALQTVSGVRLFPKFHKAKCRSLQRLGFTEKHTGIPCRPIFPQQEATMKYVWQYLQSIGHGGYLNKPLDVPKTASILPECTLSEIPPDQRYKNYLRLVKRSKHQHRAIEP